MVAILVAERRQHLALFLARQHRVVGSVGNGDDWEPPIISAMHSFAAGLVIRAILPT